jgi:hypothetical protein
LNASRKLLAPSLSADLALDTVSVVRHSGLVNADRSPSVDAPLSQALIGSWELTSRIDRTAAGEPLVDPTLGTDPIALLIYDAAGHFAAQFMKRDRSQAVESTVATVSQNNSRAQGGYDAYFGTYTTDDENSTVTQVLSGALSHENVGQTLTREMDVVGDDLTIQLETVAATGEPITRTLRWRRVG